MPQSSTVSVDLDVHQEAMAVASVVPEHSADVGSLGIIGTRPCAIDPLIRVQAYGQAVTAHIARFHRLAQDRHEPGQPWRLAPGVETLQGRREGQFSGAVPPGAALGDPEPTHA
jgi:hypothetical protein